MQVVRRIRVWSGVRRSAACAGVALGLLGAATPAQAVPTPEQFPAQVKTAGVLEHLLKLQGIALGAGGNRFGGLPGHDRSAQYVFDRLTAAGYAPQFQEFTYDAFFERRPATLLRLSPRPAAFRNGIDFRVLSFSGSGPVSGRLATPSGDSRGCVAADYTGFTAGRIALVDRGTPAGFPGGTCTFRNKVDAARAAGATAVLVANDEPGVASGTLGEAGGLAAIPALGLTQALGAALRDQVAAGRVTLGGRTDTGAQTLTTRNVIAETPGGRASNVVMVGAHLDSVGAGPGINDNGTGSAAILEVAEELAKSGWTPPNKVRFAWWSAEESGLVGSEHYVAGLDFEQLLDIALYLNVDMIGSPNFARFVYDGDGTVGPAGPFGSAQIEAAFTGYLGSRGLASEPTPFDGRSDYGPFIAQGVPAGGLFTGAEGIKTAEQAQRYGGTAGVAFDRCYHASCDTLLNVNLRALDQMTDALASVTVKYATSTEEVNGVPGGARAAGAARSAVRAGRVAQPEPDTA